MYHLIYNIYNFPNPFKGNTYFTFNYSQATNLNVLIEIFTLGGNRINTIHNQSVMPTDNSFYRFPSSGWDGKDYNGNKIANGTYIYLLHIEENDNIIYKNYHKITKID